MRKEIKQIKKQKNKRINKKQGFTLIEIMVVVAIIIILSTVATMTFKNMKYRKAKLKVTNELSDFLTKNISHFDKFGDNYIIALDVDSNDDTKVTLSIFNTKVDKEGFEIEKIELPDSFYYDIGLNQPGKSLSEQGGYLINNEEGKVYTIKTNELGLILSLSEKIKEKEKEYKKEISNLLLNTDQKYSRVIDNGDYLSNGKKGEILLKITDAYKEDKNSDKKNKGDKSLGGKTIRNIYFKYNAHLKKLNFISEEDKKLKKGK